jgi:hypothetical protein
VEASQDFDWNNLGSLGKLLYIFFHSTCNTLKCQDALYYQYFIKQRTSQLLQFWREAFEGKNRDWERDIFKLKNVQPRIIGNYKLVWEFFHSRIKVQGKFVKEIVKFPLLRTKPADTNS